MCEKACDWVCDHDYCLGSCMGRAWEGDDAGDLSVRICDKVWLVCCCPVWASFFCTVSVIDYAKRDFQQEGMERAIEDNDKGKCEQLLKTVSYAKKLRAKPSRNLELCLRCIIKHHRTEILKLLFDSDIDFTILTTHSRPSTVYDYYLKEAILNNSVEVTILFLTQNQSEKNFQYCLDICQSRGSNQAREIEAYIKLQQEQTPPVLK